MENRRRKPEFWVILVQVGALPGHWSLWFPDEAVECGHISPWVGVQEELLVAAVLTTSSPPQEQAPPLLISKCACGGGGGLPCPRPQTSLSPWASQRVGRPSLAGRGGAGYLCHLSPDSRLPLFRGEVRLQQRQCTLQADRNPTDNWEERKRKTLKFAVSYVHFF